MSVRKQTFLKGVLIIMAAQILIKLMGFIYRIVLTNFEEFSDLGNSFYGSGFSVYAFILAIATMGIPSTISKLVSEKLAIGDKRGAHKIFRIAMVLFTFIGIIFSLILFFGSTYISNNILSNPGVKYTLMALSPAIIFVAMTAVIRGYFVGMQNMAEYSKAQILEQIVNSVFSIVFVVMLLGRTPEIMAAGSTLATTLSTIMSFFYLMRYYNKNKKDIWNEIRVSEKFAVESRTKIVKKLISYVIPISFGSVIVTLSSLIDTITVVDSLQKFHNTTLLEANKIFGMLVGKVEILNALPLAVNVAFAVALVPFISAAMAKKNKEEVVSKVRFSLKVSGIIAIPSAVGLSLLAQPIFNLLFPNSNGGAELLKIQAFMVIFAVIAQTLYGALQGMGKLYIPGLCLVIGISIKYILNVTLIPVYGAMVAPISSVIYQFIACSFAFILLFNYLKVKPNFYDLFIKTIFATLTMAAGIIVVFKTLSMTTMSGSIITIITMFSAVIIYCISLLAFRVLKKEEILELPMGQKIYDFVSIFAKI
ncbi:MAG: polysaccharide biosynthesis protein [Clostridia bacterium]|nr:polysaccharide biosynthesis protein [Clostridia bacterium]MDD4386664.1 polysaccharide biosynthesis protein [Clostridia bacterium]